MSLRYVQAMSDPQLETIRDLFRRYHATIGIDLSFQNFEDELAGLPGKYTPPSGRLYLIYEMDGVCIGCVALRPLKDGMCEVKRMYILPEHQGKGYGRQVMEHMLDEARRIGYRQMVLDTMTRLQSAIHLYQKLGFETVPPYTHNPQEDVQFLGKVL